MGTPTEQGILKIVQFANGHSVDTQWTLDGHSMDTGKYCVFCIHDKRELMIKLFKSRVYKNHNIYQCPSSVHRVSIECPLSVHQVSIVKLYNLAHIMLGPCLAGGGAVPS